MEVEDRASTKTPPKPSIVRKLSSAFTGRGRRKSSQVAAATEAAAVLAPKAAESAAGDGTSDSTSDSTSGSTSESTSDSTSGSTTNSSSDSSSDSEYVDLLKRNTKALEKMGDEWKQMKGGKGGSTWEERKTGAHAAGTISMGLTSSQLSQLLGFIENDIPRLKKVLDLKSDNDNNNDNDNDDASAVVVKYDDDLDLDHSFGFKAEAKKVECIDIES